MGFVEPDSTSPLEAPQLASLISNAYVMLRLFPVHSNILFVSFSGAGPPFSQLYLMPKSSLMPPGEGPWPYTAQMPPESVTSEVS